MKIRATILTLALAAGLAGAAGTAFADAGAPSGPSPEQIAARCSRAHQRLDRLNTLAGKLADRIVAVQAKIDGGELTEEQLARAQSFLSRLQDRQTRLADRIAKLSGKIADHCDATSATA